jgi:hypothetical protein
LTNEKVLHEVLNVLFLERFGRWSDSRSNSFVCFRAGGRSSKRAAGTALTSKQAVELRRRTEEHRRDAGVEKQQFPKHATKTRGKKSAQTEKRLTGVVEEGNAAATHPLPDSFFFPSVFVLQRSIFGELRKQNATLSGESSSAGSAEKPGERKTAAVFPRAGNACAGFFVKETNPPPLQYCPDIGRRHPRSSRS